MALQNALVPMPKLDDVQDKWIEDKTQYHDKKEWQENILHIVEDNLEVKVTEYVPRDSKPLKDPAYEM